MKKIKVLLIILSTILITALVTTIISIVVIHPMLNKEAPVVSNISDVEVKEIDVKEDGDEVLVKKEDYEYLLSLYDKYKKLESLEDYIRENYYKDVDDVDFMSDTIKGMFQALDDPYSQYFTPEEFKAYNEDSTGVYEGIGVIVAPGDDGYITVVSPIHDSPGFEAGLKTNDKIILVDGVEYFADELSEAVMNIRGPAETTVILSIRRDNEMIDIPVVRRKIKLEAVSSEILEGHIGYIKIASFDQDVSIEFMNHLSELENQGIDSLILDLRYNGGGYLGQCLRLTDLLIGEGVIVKTKDNKGNIDVESSDANKIDYPLVVLVNEGSASASEILTGAVKDNEEGIIIGTTTFGKGLVQTMLPLPMFDESGFKLTIEQYFTPNDHYIHGIGIEPNIVIEDDDETEIDEQLEKALEVIKQNIK